MRLYINQNTRKLNANRRYEIYVDQTTLFGVKVTLKIKKPSVKMGNGGSASNKNGTLKETMGDHEGSINCMALSEDGSLLVTGSEDSTARMWSTKTDETECIGVLK